MVDKEREQSLVTIPSKGKIGRGKRMSPCLGETRRSDLFVDPFVCEREKAFLQSRGDNFMMKIFNCEEEIKMKFYPFLFQGGERVTLAWEGEILTTV